MNPPVSGATPVCTDPAYLSHTASKPWLRDHCTCRTRSDGTRYFTCATAGCSRVGQACGGYCGPCFNRIMSTPPAIKLRDLARRCHANSAKWFPTNHLSERSAVTHCTLGLAGEAGEVANKVKKLYGYIDQTIPAELRADIIGELIDTLIYDLVLLDVLGADIDAEVERTVAKCVARWGAEADVPAPNRTSDDRSAP